MAGTKAGSAKTKAKLLAKDPEHFANIGKNSWKNPDRSHKTGFALLDEQTHKEISANGGKKTKEEYRRKEALDAAIAEIESFGPSEGKSIL